MYVLYNFLFHYCIILLWYTIIIIVFIIQFCILLCYTIIIIVFIIQFCISLLYFIIMLYNYCCFVLRLCCCCDTFNLSGSTFYCSILLYFFCYRIIRVMTRHCKITFLILSVPCFFLYNWTKLLLRKLYI